MYEISLLSDEARSHIQDDFPPKQLIDCKDHTAPFWSGLSIAARSRYVFNRAGLFVNDKVDNNWACVQTDKFPIFKRIKHIDCSAIFFHNSDAAIKVPPSTQDIPWFCVNAECDHPLVKGIALGIGYPPYAHGDVSAILKAIATTITTTTTTTTPHHPPTPLIEKSEMFYANYHLATNPIVRQKCLDKTGVPLNEVKPFSEYLLDLKKSYFCICPSGVGIETHRTTEAWLMGTIPVVTRSVMARDHMSSFPLVVLDSWEDFQRKDFTRQRFFDIWGELDPTTFYKRLYTDNYLDWLRTRGLS